MTEGGFKQAAAFGGPVGEPGRVFREEDSCYFWCCSVAVGLLKRAGKFLAGAEDFAGEWDEGAGFVVPLHDALEAGALEGQG